LFRAQGGKPAAMLLKNIDKRFRHKSIWPHRTE
jgi:hypothetical protein